MQQIFMASSDIEIMKWFRPFMRFFEILLNSLINKRVFWTIERLLNVNEWNSCVHVIIETFFFTRASGNGILNKIYPTYDFHENFSNNLSFFGKYTLQKLMWPCMKTKKKSTMNDVCYQFLNIFSKKKKKMMNYYDYLTLLSICVYR